VRLARFRLRIARRVAPPWIVAVVLAVVTGSIVWAALAAADRRQRAWGGTDLVVVASRAVAAGEPLVAANTRRLPVPRSLAPADAVHELPAAALTSVALAAGEPVRLARLVGPGVAVAGTMLLAVPTGPTSPPLHAGDHLDLYGRAPVAIAEDVATITVAADRAVVAARPEQVGAIVAALADGPLVIAVHR
jgi:hypothetical protein